MSSTRSVMWWRPGPALLDVFRDGRVGRRRFKQLQLRAADGNVPRAHALRDNLFRRFDLEPERVTVERKRRLDVLHRDPDVIEHRLHTSSARLIRLAAAAE